MVLSSIYYYNFFTDLLTILLAVHVSWTSNLALVSESDLDMVLKELHKARNKWYILGLQLGLTPSLLKTIYYLYNDHLKEMLMIWLQLKVGWQIVTVRQVRFACVVFDSNISLVWWPRFMYKWNWYWKLLYVWLAEHWRDSPWMLQSHWIHLYWIIALLFL